MHTEALFINGVFESVLEEILQIQSVLPEQILFLQPYTSRPMTLLRDKRPSVDKPMRLFLSLTTDLPTVRYAAEIVGWDDKGNLSIDKQNALNRVIAALQPNERYLYNASPTGEDSVNLLYVRRLQKLESPFSVERLIKLSDDHPLSINRTTSGGWSYVNSESVP